MSRVHNSSYETQYKKIDHPLATVTTKIIICEVAVRFKNPHDKKTHKTQEKHMIKEYSSQFAKKNASYRITRERDNWNQT